MVVAENDIDLYAVMCLQEKILKKRLLFFFKSMFENSICKLGKPPIHVVFITWYCSLQKSYVAAMRSNHHCNIVVLLCFLNWNG